MELEFIQWLSERLARHAPNRQAAIRLGVGDDAALLELADEQCVLTTDMLMDGTDFLTSEHPLELIGRKALAVNLSDLAAMAVVPVAALVAIALPQRDALATAQRLYEGMLPLAAEFDVALIGGDTNCWNESLVISVTAVGRCQSGRALRRSGARSGDSIIVSGSFGASLAGKHFEFQPRVHEAQLLNEQYQLHAGCDVSDGLALDLSRIAAASGCGAIVFAEQIPLSDAVSKAYGSDRSSAQLHALSDGEDFELILAVPAAEADRMLSQQPCAVPLTRIGMWTAEPGLWLQDAGGHRRPLAPSGWVHGAKDHSP